MLKNKFRAIVSSLFATTLISCGTVNQLPYINTQAVSQFNQNISYSTYKVNNNKTNLAFFIGMDDYMGGMQGKLVKKVYEQLSYVGSQEDLNIFMSADSDVKNDGFRTRITKGQKWNENFISMGELNTGQTPALRDYIRWFGLQSPAQFTHLVLNSHGGAYSGNMYDYQGDVKGPSENLSLQQLIKALSKGYTGNRIDSVNFDACMMATIEVGESIKGGVKAFSGSQDFSIVNSFRWDRALPTILSKGKITTGERYLKQVVSDAVNRGNYGPNRGSQTWSAISLNRDFDVLVAKVDRLAQALMRRLKVNPEEIKQAARDTKMFSIMAQYKEHYGDFYQRDIIEFCEILIKTSTDPIVKRSATDVINAVKKVIIAETHSASETMAHGLAIYLPHDANWKVSGNAFRTYQKTDFARHTNWDEFLIELNK